MLRLASLLGLLALGCGNVKNEQSIDAPPTPDDASPGLDSTLPARCDPSEPFGAATLVANVNSSNEEFSFGIVRDESTAFVGRIVQPPNSSATILATTRTGDTFGTPNTTATAAINNAVGDEHSASPVADGLIVYFHRQDPNGIGIYAATRADAASAFSAGTLVSVDNQPLLNALSATISADGQTLYWLDFQDFGAVFAATRGNTPTTFTNRRRVATFAISAPPILSADELTMFYAQGNGVDVLVTTRGSTSEMFAAGVPVGNVNSNANDVPVALSHDGCVLYISSARAGGLGGSDIWEARRAL